MGIADIKEEYLIDESDNRRITKDMIIKLMVTILK